MAAVTIDVHPVNDPPVADANGPYEALAGAVVTFDGSGSYDPDGTVVSYVWDFGDGGSDAGTGVSPTHVYAAAGTYTVLLTVTDVGGLTDSTTATAEVTAA